VRKLFDQSDRKTKAETQEKRGLLFPRYTISNTRFTEKKTFRQKKLREMRRKSLGTKNLSGKNKNN